MESSIDIIEKVKLKKPIFIEGLPGVGNVGRVVAGYLISELNAKKFAEMYSPYFLPLVLLQEDSVIHPLKCEFYYVRGEKNDLVILTGDSQSSDPQGHYEFAQKVIKFVKDLGVRDVITIGGFAEGRLVQKPRVIGAVNDKELIKKYSTYGVLFQPSAIGSIVGASGLLIAEAKRNGMNGLCLLGETVGYPLITDPKAAEAVLMVLIKILDIKMDLTKIDKAVKEMEEKLKKTEEIHRKLQELSEKKDTESLKYIG